MLLRKRILANPSYNVNAPEISYPFLNKILTFRILVPWEPRWWSWCCFESPLVGNSHKETWW